MFDKRMAAEPGTSFTSAGAVGPVLANHIATAGRGATESHQSQSLQPVVEDA